MPKKPRGQLAQPFRQPQPGGFHLAVHETIGGFVLLEMGEKGKKRKHNKTGQHRQEWGAGRAPSVIDTIRPDIHKVQDADPAP